ncbi:MAG TPA: divalent-cation tolerance protein CutA [Desulfobacterales bacterium]|nr:divalent-cation tolerance protein CutA [Desulfobacterales bacterium]
MGDKKNLQEYCVILTTCGKKEEAERLARSLIGNHLAACVQVAGVTSFYEWEKKITKGEELLLLIKAKASRYDRIEEFIRENHSYEIPEIIALPIGGGLKNYFKWMDDVSS